MHRDGIIAAYMMANRKQGALYTGSTSDLARRVFEHKEGARGGFTKKYGCKRLVWFEVHDLMTGAIQRELAMKHWPRQWKINVLEADNPDWLDLYNRLNG